MKRKLLAIVAAASMGGSMAAHAVIIGDRDWRQLTETVGFSWNEVSTVCDPGTGVCSGSLGEVSFDGWIWADVHEVRNLLEELILPESIQFEDRGGGYYQSYSDSTGLISALISPDFFLPTLTSSNALAVYGLTRSLHPGSGTIALRSEIIDNADYFDYVTPSLAVATSGASPYVGFWLYRDVTSVPEPGTLVLLGLGLAGVGLARRRRAS